jgi:hypothetical protein
MSFATVNAFANAWPMVANLPSSVLPPAPSARGESGQRDVRPDGLGWIEWPLDVQGCMD